MQACSMTAGAFYAQFRSKEALLREALGFAMSDIRRRIVEGLDDLPDSARFQEIVRRYLSSVHRDSPADGCSLPSLSTEVGRSGAEVREVFQAELLEMAAAFDGHLLHSDDEVRSRALATLALCAGGVMLARAVKDQTLSDEILEACQRLALSGTT